MENCMVYIDNVVVFTYTWKSHIVQLKELLRRLSEACLVVSLKKSEFVCAEVQYLGYVVGHGKLHPPEAKIEAIKNFLPPMKSQELRRYRLLPEVPEKFCDFVTSLTELLKDNKFLWS